LTQADGLSYNDVNSSYANFPPYTFEIYGVEISVPELEADFASTDFDDTPAGYMEYARNSVEQALAAAGIGGIEVSVDVNLSEIYFSEKLTLTNVSAATEGTLPTVTPSAGGQIEIGGTLASGDVLTINVDGTSVNTTLDSSLTTAAAAATQMVADINAENITGVTAIDNGDGTFSLTKASQLSESNGTVTVGSSLSASDTLQIEIDGTTITTDITSSLTTATAAAAQMVADISAANIAGLTVTDNLDGTFALERGPSISEASGVITVGGSLSVGDTLEMTIAGTSVSTTITSSLTTASAATTQLVADITAASIN
jgi:hypothetical protein